MNAGARAVKTDLVHVPHLITLQGGDAPLLSCCLPAAVLQMEKFIDGRWQVVPPADRMKITQLDGQVRGREQLRAASTFN